MISELPFNSEQAELGKILEGIVRAGEKILEIYETDFSTQIKDDDSPVTQADIESNHIIKDVLSNTGIPILSEEDEDDKSRLDKERIWIVDPLDGTQDFINKTGEFTILVGLVKNHIPILGLVYLPTENILYLAEKDKGAFCYKSQNWRKISVRKNEDLKDCLALVSRHHLSKDEERILQNLGIDNLGKIGSALKTMEIASGRADVYLTTTNKIKQWDTCAPYCIISEAGGKMTDLKGDEILYNTEIVHHLNGILVTNGAVHQNTIEIISKLDS